MSFMPCVLVACLCVVVNTSVTLKLMRFQEMAFCLRNVACNDK